MKDVPVELYREFMTDISDEIDRENQIIEDLLMLVKMDKTAEDQMNIEQVNINGELELILKRLRPIAKRGNVELILESIREVTADVDKVKISLAITNLVENAIKYNRDSGMVRVTLDADHKYFYIKVADTGIGIPEDALEHIFERFFRVDKARSREVGGTGLGLAIAKNVIQMHHGIIDVESTVGEGTTFSVRIPLNYVPRQERSHEQTYREQTCHGNTCGEKTDSALMAVVFLLSGCWEGESPASNPSEGRYLIYYLNASITKLVPQEYETETKDKGELVNELMDQFLNVPKDLDCQPGLTDRVTYQGSRQEEQVLYLYFDMNYTAMKAEREILCRAALTRTYAD